MASVIIVVIIFVLLALAILFICQNGGWQGGGNQGGYQGGNQGGYGNNQPRNQLVILNAVYGAGGTTGHHAANVPAVVSGRRPVLPAQLGNASGC